MVGDCNVTEPRYADNRLHQGHIYQIAITPRSNGENAQNGSENTKTGTCTHALRNNIHTPINSVAFKIIVVSPLNLTRFLTLLNVQHTNNVMLRETLL